MASLPCSAGIYLYHYIAKTLSASAWTTGETNPFSRGSQTSYCPEDPLHLVRSQKLISWSAAFDEYRRRLHQLVELFLASDTASVLVIRDHTYGEGWRFNKTEQRSTSPALTEVLNRQGLSPHCFFTHRDPFDTWISMCRSFPQPAKPFGDLDHYATYYHRCWKTWSDYAHPLHNLHIEALATDENHQRKRILSSVFGNEALASLQLTNDDVAIPRQEMGSGASGRRQERPTLMKRRPCSTKILVEAIHSPALRQLRNDLGYYDPIEMTMRLRISCLRHDVRLAAHQGWHAIRGRG